MAASGHSASSLLAAVQKKEPHYTTIYAMQCWRGSKTRPRVNKHLDVVDKIEQYFGLPEGRLAYLVGLRSTKQYRKVKDVYSQLLQIVRWHLPDDYDQRSEAERREILSWISRNVLPGSTGFGKYQSENSRDKFSVVFPTLPRQWGGHKWMGDIWHKFRENNSGCTVIAPAELVREMRDVLALKTALLPPKGYRRAGRWADTTAQTHVRRYGTIFGLFAADPSGPICGLGIPVSNLTFGLFVFPDIWDWYLRWYEKKRGFFSSSDLTALYELKGFVRKRTGWIRQHPELGRKLRPVIGLISAADIVRVRSNWDKACDEVFEYAIDRVQEIAPLQRIHRDPFIPIMPVLTANNPLREYKKIGDELLRRMPNERKYPMHAATAVRAYLMFRFAIHLGSRQRNLRELLVCLPGHKPRETRELELLRRGELRWLPDSRTWHVFIPSIAIKNGHSAFFRGRPFEMTLPDLAQLYKWIDRYLTRDRLQLLNGVKDPGTFFVRTLWDTSIDPEHNMNTFHQCWRDMILRYGIFNPYTNRGAIKGLLPHGPHAVRDVLATHLLKTTGSYELASFAIQDSLEAVMKHYARFLPHEKVARAAEEVNKVWRRGGSRKVVYRGDPAGMTQIVCRRRGRRNLVRDTSKLVFL
jgi:hypothetical protein